MYSVLLVDDEPWIIEGLKVTIDWIAEGFRIMGSATNGLEALRLIREKHPDLVLIDIRMPGLNGLKTIRSIREENGNTQFIIVSGYAEFEYAQEGIDLHVAGYLLKPVDEKQLRDMVHRIYLGLETEKVLLKRPLIEEKELSPQEYIQRHFLENLEFDTFCKHFGKSATAMRTLLLQEISMPFAQYLTELRMQHAAQMLSQTDISVNEIAVICCYEDALYFRKVFKKRFGMSPSDYRASATAE